MRLSGQWVMEPSRFEQFNGFVEKVEPTEAQLASFTERRAAPRSAIEMQGTEAHIRVVGVLTKEPDFFADMFEGGNTTYAEVIAGIAEAEADASVETIVLDIDSPGGEVRGWLAAMEAVGGTSKPTHARVTDLAASAAYGIAVQADSITVNDKLAEVGSIGVATTRFVSENRVEITSTNAPNKRPDASTEEGVAAIRAELDQIHNVFADLVSAGRGVNRAKVDKDFGRGGLVLAEKALTAGMIDGISSATSTTDPTASGGEMDLAKLKAEHRSVYDAVFNEGVEAGSAKERDRCSAHATMGEAAGSPELALKHISEGSEFTSTVQAAYAAEALKGAEHTARVSDDKDAPDPKDKDDRADSGKDTKASVFDAAFAEVNEQLGLDDRGNRRDARI